jgi:hypothetical protein
VKTTLLPAALSALLSSSALFAQAPGTCAGMTPGQLASLNGFVPFQGASSLWNTDVSTALVDPDSSSIINFIGTSTTLHPDFGQGTYDGSYTHPGDGDPHALVLDKDGCWLYELYNAVAKRMEAGTRIPQPSGT